jgi:hypothetical protein
MQIPPAHMSMVSHLLLAQYFHKSAAYRILSPHHQLKRESKGGKFKKRGKGFTMAIWRIQATPEALNERGRMT